MVSNSKRKKKNIILNAHTRNIPVSQIHIRTIKMLLLMMISNDNGSQQWWWYINIFYITCNVCLWQWGKNDSLTPVNTNLLQHIKTDVIRSNGNPHRLKSRNERKKSQATTIVFFHSISLPLLYCIRWAGGGIYL